MTLSIIALIGIAVVSAGLGFATATLLAAGGRADLCAHIIALRDAIHQAHQRLLALHREHGGQTELLKKIETTIEATFDD